MARNQPIPDVIIREAEPDDAAALLAYIDETAGETDFLGFGSAEFDMDVEKEKTFIEEHRTNPNCLFLIALSGDEIAGSLSFSGGHRKRTRHTGEFGIVVRKRYWGQGIAGMLLDALIEWARGTGIVTKLDLLVRADNERAIQLYERKGFEREGRIRRSVCIGGVYHDALCMGLILDEET